MTFTGSELTIKRNFFTQTGEFGLSVGCTVDNTSGRYQFGLSGAQGTIEFSLESGRLYYQNQFLHTYAANETFLIEAQFTSGTVNVIKDAAPLVYGAPKATGAFDYFYLTRTNDSLGATIDLNISGNSIPTYTITQQGYLAYSGQNAVTGYFVNQSPYPIRVFDSTIQASADYEFGKLAGFVSSSGSFAYSGDFDAIDFSQPILTTFNTNFANIDILFSISDVRSLNRFVQLTSPTDLSFNSDGQIPRTVSWLNYSGGFVTDFPTQLTFALKYVSGDDFYSDSFTGTWDLLTGVNASSLVSLKSLGSFNADTISGSGHFSPNSQMFMTIIGSGTGVNSNSAQFILSGTEVVNPINQVIISTI